MPARVPAMVNVGAGKSFRRAVVSEEGRLLHAAAAARLLATLSCGTASTCPALHNDLAVAADRQRRGIGRAIVTELLSLAHKAGINTTFVPAENENTHALEFYRAVGGVPSPVTFFTFSR